MLNGYVQNVLDNFTARGSQDALGVKLHAEYRQLFVPDTHIYALELSRLL